MENHAKTGGILTIIAGAFGVLWLAWAVFAILMMRFMFSMPYHYYPSTPPPGFFTLIMIFYSAFGVFFLLVGVLGIVGGVFALKKKLWGLALAGAIAGTVTFFPCGIPGIIFVTMAKPEFSARKPARRRRK